MKIKSILTLAACAFTIVAAATSTPKGFTEDLDAAIAEAKTSGKYVYACFSGSDWCIWCKRLESEVFSDKTFDFVGALKDDYIFVFIDSPRDKSVLSEKAKENNPKLTKKFEVRGYPTALILDGEGKQLGKTGYRAGGAKAYAQYLKLFKKFGEEGLNKKTAEIDKKYFAATTEKLGTALKPLQQNQPSVDDFKNAKVAFEGLVKELEEIKIDPADAELGEMQRAAKIAQIKRFIGMIERDLARRAAKAKEANKDK